jgi:chemosensory pili system protein ChpE
MDQLFATMIGLGFAFSATPGAVNAESLRRGVARGFWPAFLVQLGALIGDTVWAAMALTGTAFVVRSPSLAVLLGVAGGCSLLRLAWRALRESWVGGMPEVRAGGIGGDFLTGAFFSLANPFALAFWLGIGGGMVATVTSGNAIANSFVFVIGFVCGALVWCAGASAVIAWGRRLIRPTLIRWLNGICGALLGYFGVRLLWQTLRSLHVLRWLRLAGV